MIQTLATENNCLQNTDPLLFPDTTVPVSMRLSAAIGFVEAAILQQIHFWCRNPPRIINGIPWIWKTYHEWTKFFGSISRRKIVQAIANLRELKLIRVKRLSANTYYQANWYSVDWEQLNLLWESIGPKENYRCAQNEPIDHSKMIQSSNKKENSYKKPLIKKTPTRPPTCVVEENFPRPETAKKKQNIETLKKSKSDVKKQGEGESQEKVLGLKVELEVKEKDSPSWKMYEIELPNPEETVNLDNYQKSVIDVKEEGEGESQEKAPGLKVELEVEVEDTACLKKYEGEIPQEPEPHQDLENGQEVEIERKEQVDLESDVESDVESEEKETELEQDLEVEAEDFPIWEKYKVVLKRNRVNLEEKRLQKLMKSSPMQVVEDAILAWLEWARVTKIESPNRGLAAAITQQWKPANPPSRTEIPPEPPELIAWAQENSSRIRETFYSDYYGCWRVALKSGAQLNWQEAISAPAPEPKKKPVPEVKKISFLEMLNIWLQDKVMRPEAMRLIMASGVYTIEFNEMGEERVVEVKRNE